MTKKSQSKASSGADLYQQITDKIVLTLEKGTLPWRRPWYAAKTSGKLNLPINALTQRAYQGVNVLLLWLAALDNGFSCDHWLTYRQAQQLGGQVRKGESAALGVIFKPFERQLRDTQGKLQFDKDNQPVKVSSAFIKPLYLFNVEQCEGLSDKFSVVEPTMPMSSTRLNAKLEQRITGLCQKIGVKLASLEQDRAYYSRKKDCIVLPLVEQFFTQSDYWATLLHELVHATGHSSRLNREGITTYQPDVNVNAFEELVAEMGSAFLCAQLGVQGEVQHASYLANWLNVLKADKRALFRACRQAREASEFLLMPTTK